MVFYIKVYSVFRSHLSNITQLICTINFTGSPSANFGIPSSAELSPVSLDSSSALVLGNSSVSGASAGEYNHLACDRIWW